jgi:hypothetical protein
MTVAYAPRAVVRRPQAVRFPSPAHRRRRALAERARNARVRAIAYLLGEIVLVASAAGLLTHRLAGG